MQKETRWYLKNKWDSNKGSHIQMKQKHYNGFLWSASEFTLKLFAFVVIRILFLFLLPPTVCLFLIPRAWEEEGRGNEIKITVFYPLWAFWLRDVRSEEVLVAKVWFIDCGCCLFLFLAMYSYYPSLPHQVLFGQKREKFNKHLLNALALLCSLS